MVVLTMSTGMGVRELHKRAFDKYGHGRSTGTDLGVPYIQQRAFVRAFSRNFTMTSTVWWCLFFTPFHQTACKVVTALMHYFFLATFTWTLCEAVLICFLLVKVFGANNKKWIFLYLTLGWGKQHHYICVQYVCKHVLCIFWRALSTYATNIWQVASIFISVILHWTFMTIYQMSL